MACCVPDAVRIKKPNAHVLKTGYLKIYERGFISSGWKARYFVFYEDSSLVWYESHESFHHKGGVRLKMVANYMAVGPMCLHITGLPQLPKGCVATHVMGVPNLFQKGTKKQDIVMNWILFEGGDEQMKAWLEAIKPTLPPPPPRPERPPHKQHKQQNGQAQTNGHAKQSQPPPYGNNVVHPSGNASYPANGGYQGRPQNNTTVIYQNNERSNDFATGVLVGGAVGYGPGWGWGWGWGWGPTPYGGYWGSWSSFGGSHGGGGMNIENNYYDCNQNDYGYDYNDVGDLEGGIYGGGDFGIGVAGGGCGGGGCGDAGGGCGGGCGGCGGGCGGCGG